MKKTIIYDSNGKIWNIISGTENAIQNIQSMEVDIPDGAGIEKINLENPDEPYPVLVWPISEISEKTELYKDVLQQAKAGKNLREIIADLDLTNKEKWELENAVKEEMQSGI